MTTTLDDFLGGCLRVHQPAKGYRAGVDPVMLAASVPAKAGESVLELGIGVGVASLCLAHRVEGVHITGVEVQPEYASLARRNAEENNLPITVVEGDLTALSPELRQMQFDHVIANPPYFDRSESSPSPIDGREIAMGEGTDLATWVKVASKRVAPKGYAHFIHRAERLDDLLRAFSLYFGAIEVFPICPRVDRDAQLVIIRGRKGAKGKLKLNFPIVMHAGAEHLADGEDYFPEINAVLRDGAGLAAFGTAKIDTN